MKTLVILMVCMLPVLLYAQDKCVYFEKMVNLKVDKIDINTSQSDFGPAFVADELWFSAYTNEEIKKLSEGKDKKIYYNLFQTKTDSEGNIVGDKLDVFEKQSKGYHSGPVSYCAKTGELFVTLSNFENPEIRNKVYKKAEIRLKIVIAKQEDGEWKITGELPYNNPAYSVGHPTISTSGDTLYFTSDIPDKGFGGTDIYRAVRSNGVWGEMQNMGDQINTEKNEMFPFLYKNKLLIFASNGRAESDDLNLYNVGLFGDKMTGVAELTDLNSDADDFGFVIHPKDKVGYFVSNREGGVGSDDIYKVLIEKIPQGKYELELIVKDRKTNEQIPNAKISFGDALLTISGGVFNKVLEKDKTYTVKTNLEGYMNDSKTVSTVGKAFGVIKETLWVEKVVVGQKFVMDNIYYDFDKWDILPESKIELDKLVKVMKDNPSWKVELGSHTDSRGSDAYNKKLSQKRSDSAVEYIVNKGIAQDRIIAKGYGETELINQCSNGVKCSDEEHRANRRTEFKVLEMDGK